MAQHEISCEFHPLTLLTQLQFFSSLVPAGLVSPASLLELYKSLLMVLQELGGGGERAERVVRSVGEGLMRVSRCVDLR